MTLPPCLNQKLRDAGVVAALVEQAVELLEGELALAGADGVDVGRGWRPRGG